MTCEETGLGKATCLQRIIQSMKHLENSWIQVTKGRGRKKLGIHCYWSGVSRQQDSGYPRWWLAWSRQGTLF